MTVLENPVKSTEPRSQPPEPKRARVDKGELKRSAWAAATSVGLHLFIVALGMWTVTDALLEEIARGEILAMADPDPFNQAIEVEFYEAVPEPEPVAEPEFVVPEEKKEVEPEPEKPKPKPVPTPRPAVAGAVRQEGPPGGFAASAPVVGSRNFPKPPYPFQARQRRQQGTVLLRIVVVGGSITEVNIARSSGHGILDSTAQSWVKSRWNFPAGLTRTLQQEIQFELAAP
ncbi:MAG: energy transducer TonB [Verrucomicrobiia bacterium]